MSFIKPVVEKIKTGKKGLIVAIASLVALTAATGIHSAQVSAEVTPTAGNVLFEDDFNGTAGSQPDQSKWEDYSTCTYNGSAAFGNIKCGDNETLDGNGNLVIPATPTDGSAIRTGDKFKFQYGTVSAWIKMPPQTGYWPAFWTLNNNANGVDVLPVGEIDVMEGYTTWNDVYHAVGHSWTGNEATDHHSADNRCAEGSGANLTTAFHKYSAKVEPNKVTYYFNDVECGVAYTPSEDPAKAWALGPNVTRGNWLILNLAIGGAGGQQIPATEAAQMLVDRVEVRSLDTGTPPTPTPTVVSGETYRLENQCGGKVLDVPAASTAVAQALSTWSWNGGDHQQWTPVDVGDGYFKLINKNSTQAMNVNYNSTANGALIIQYPDFGGSNQEWKITHVGDGYFQVVSRHSGKALDVSGANPDNGASVIQWDANDTCAQKWKFVK